MFDRNGKEIKIGIKLKPVKGQIVKVIDQPENYEELRAELGEFLWCQQIENPDCFSPLTQENLSSQWTIVEEGEDG